MKPEKVLLLTFERNETGEDITIFDYLKLLLTTLWDELEGFDGKRPFGNSGLEYDVYTPLVKHGVLKGTLDEDGFINNPFDEKAARLYVIEVLIPAAFKKL